MLPPRLGSEHHHRGRSCRQGNQHAAISAGYRSGVEGHSLRGARGRTDVPRIVDWYMEKKIDIDNLITHRLPLERINEGFDLMERGESIRSVVVY